MTTLAVRPMSDPGAMPDAALMDEATIDCSICGRPAILEYRLDTLDDTANWRRTKTWLACVEHQDHYDVRAAWLGRHDRMTIQRCG